MTRARICMSLALLAAMTGATAIAATPREQLAEAARLGQTAFILVTDQTVASLDQAKSLMNDVLGKVKDSVAVELDRGDAANADLVAEFRLASAPVPLILVVATNGMIAGGAPADQVTADQLLTLIPSPKKAEIIKQLQAGKAVFAVVSRSGMSAIPQLNDVCSKVCAQMDSKTVVVNIDLDDPNEQEHLKMLRVDPAAKEPVVLAINAQGQITGSFDANVVPAELAQAAVKRAGGGCAPGACGPSSSCGPVSK